MNRMLVMAAVLVTAGGCATPPVPEWAKVSPAQIEAARRLGVPVAFENAFGIRMILVPAGAFTMGSPKSDDLRAPDETPHRVRLTKPFYIGMTEITQAEYKTVTGKTPSYHAGDNRPVEQVSWHEATAFCKTLSDRTGRRYALPTEAQWEYACRAGTQTRFCFGDDVARLKDYAWYTPYAGCGTQSVATHKPNLWGLYDMHGNLFEWCRDFLRPYAAGDAVDPVVETGRGERVVRGGTWTHHPTHCRSAFRYHDVQTHRHDIIGFRVVADVKKK